MFEKIRNTLIATSVLYLLFGIIMLFFPTMVITSVCYLVGIMFLFVASAGMIVTVNVYVSSTFSMSSVLSKATERMKQRTDNFLKS